MTEAWDLEDDLMMSSRLIFNLQSRHFTEETRNYSNMLQDKGQGQAFFCQF